MYKYYTVVYIQKKLLQYSIYVVCGNFSMGGKNNITMNKYSILYSCMDSNPIQTEM